MHSSMTHHSCVEKCAAQNSVTPNKEQLGYTKAWKTLQSWSGNSSAAVFWKITKSQWKQLLCTSSMFVCLCVGGCVLPYHQSKHSHAPTSSLNPTWILSSQLIFPSIYLLSFYSPGRLGRFMTLWHCLMVFKVDILWRFAPSTLSVFSSLFLFVSVPEVRLNLPCAHQNGWGEMIWLMHITSLSIHDYFLESIRPIWLI